MDIDSFIRFIAFLGFAFFNIYWNQRFPYPRFRWITHILQAVGVVGALWTLLGV